MNKRKNNLLYIPKNIWINLSSLRKKQLIFLGFLNIASGISEVFSLISIMPFLEIITSPNKNITTNKLPFNGLIQFIFIDAKPENLLFISTIFVIKVIFITSLIRLLNLYLNSKISALIGTDFSSNLFKVTLSKPYSWHIKTNSSSSISSTTFQTDQMVTGIKALLMSFTALIVTIFITLSLLFINFKITIFSLLLFTLIYSIMALFTKKILSRNSKSIIMNDKLRIKILQEGIGNIREVILNSNKSYFLEKFYKANRNTRLANANNQFLSSYPRFVLEGLSIITLALISFSLQRFDNNEINLLPILGTFILGIQRLLPSIQQLYTGLILVKGNSISILSVIEKLNDKQTDNFYKHSKFKSFEIIKIQNLNYKYPFKTNLILKNINFSIKTGEKIGIIGATGSGKTTLINILMGLLEPYSGKVLIDGKDIFSEKHNRSWREFISHVPQNIYLSDNSIYENIAFGKKKNTIDYERVIDSSKKAQLHKFITETKFGYDTIIGELGIKLSGGQRQRIAIARALYKNANFLIFDEATSALDNACEKILMEEVYALRNISIIMIAHRLSTLSKCDKVIELSEGRIIKIYRGDDIKEISK